MEVTVERMRRTLADLEERMAAVERRIAELQMKRASQRQVAAVLDPERFKKEYPDGC